jgi:hypothetical protein
MWLAGQLEINLAAYKDPLVHVAELVEGLGEVPVFVTQTRANVVTLEVCRERHVVCLDLATELRFSEGDFYDYEHNTPLGAEKIGRWLADKLAGLV